jgi:ABC-type transport system involved in cytochrome c biogenesis permease subunit
MKPKQTQPEPSERAATPWYQWAPPVAITLLVLVYLLMGVARASSGGEMTRYDMDTLGKVPVSKDGRVKPLDTVARNSLLMVSGKQSLTEEMLVPSDNGVEQPAIVWLAELIADRPEARQRKVLRIDDPGVLGLMGKTPEDGKFYSLADLSVPSGEDGEPVIFEIERLANEARNVRDDQRSKFQEHVIGLRSQVSTMLELQSMRSPFVIPPGGEGEDWQPMVEDPRLGLTPAARERAAGQSWIEVMAAFDEDPAAFNAALTKHMQLVSDQVPGPTRKAAFERGYNRYEPFVKGVALYVLAGLLSLFALLLRPLLSPGWYKALWRSGLGVLTVTFLLHTAALIIRIWLQGRPPVTNLYSSAVFIGWGMVGGAIILELISRLGVAALASCVGGVATLIVAHNLAKDGDTMGVMQAVLDSNFWLGTHVITIVIGYLATFLAGLIAIIYILLGMCTPILDRKSSRVIAGMVYGTICFALLFSFVGTVLGGIWADQSWGRFWGWDPKENGAILIVLMNAIILHARWGHLIKERGLMVLAVGGNVITAWSWFGTNLLGVGLHSYGFMDGAMFWLAGFAASQMLIMAVALIVPTQYWWSFSKPTKPKDGKNPTKREKKAAGPRPSVSGA